MEKQFSVPKEFGKEWLIALRSGEYKQGMGNLFYNDKYCCIGVAGIVCKIPTIDMHDRSLFDINNYLPENMPNIISELRGNSNNNSLVKILVELNDGSKTQKQRSFLQIADWIENNVDFI